MTGARGAKIKRVCLIYCCIVLVLGTWTLIVDASKLNSPAQRTKLSDEGADDLDGIDTVVSDYERSATDSTVGRRSSLKSDVDEKRSGGGVDKLEKRLPSALIIGVKKAGTRALLEFLRLHPDVRATGPETHFFDRHYNRGIEWYRLQMPLTLPDQITMEKTPSYFVTPEVPERIRAMRPDARLLVVVRDPVTRALSDYAQTASKRPDTTLPFEVLAFSKRRRKRSHVSLRHRDPSSRKVRARSRDATFSSGGNKTARDSTGRRERVLISRARKNDTSAFREKQLRGDKKPFNEDGKLNSVDAERVYAENRNGNGYREEQGVFDDVTSKSQDAFTAEVIVRNSELRRGSKIYGSRHAGRVMKVQGSQVSQAADNIVDMDNENNNAVLDKLHSETPKSHNSQDQGNNIRNTGGTFRNGDDRTTASLDCDDVTEKGSSSCCNNGSSDVNESWSGIRIGLYARHLTLWLAHFPQSQIHVVSGEELVRNPAREMAMVQDFLGLRRLVSEDHFYFNRTKGFPCLKKSEGSGSPHCLGKTKGRTHPRLSEENLRRLRRFFEPHNRRFYRMVHRDFHWESAR